MTAGVALSSLRSGERIDPTRRQLKIVELADDIAARGLLCPLLVTPERLIVDGERRKAALELLEQQGRPVPALVRILATTKEAIDLLDTEWAANEQREPHTPEARYRYAQRRLVLEQAAAAERRAAGASAGGKAKAALDASGPADPEAHGPSGDEGGRAATRAAKAAGFSSRKELERVAKVVEAAEVDPERFGVLRDELNKTGKAAAVAAKLERLEEGADPDSWCTPPWVLEAVHAIDEEISLDPCTNANAIRLGHVRAGVDWTIDDDALAQTSWDVEPGWTVIWYQPPYSDPGELTARLVKEWDLGGIRRVHALVKLDTSTTWWAALRDRAAFVILPRRRLAHVVGDKPRKGSDFCSAIFVLSRGDRAELLELYGRLRDAYAEQADVYPTGWILDEPAAPAKRARKPRKDGKR